MSFAALVCATVALGAPESVRRADFEGWKGCYVLSNGLVDLVVAPQIGRIVRFGNVGGPNLPWLNPNLKGKVLPVKEGEWNNYGGDKLWTAPQSDWTWPPDPAADGLPHTAALRGRVLHLTSTLSPRFRTRFVREISLVPGRREALIRNHLEFAGPGERRLAVWQIAQMDDPDWAMLNLNPAGRHPKGWYDYPGATPGSGSMHEVADGRLLFRRAPTEARKVGGDHPDGKVWASIGGTILEMSSPFEPGREYPDEGSQQQIYANPDPLKYIELELAGPLTPLRPGQRTSQNVRWRILP